MGADTWEIIEIMGHQRIAGKVREVARAGVQMLEVVVPEVDGRPSFTKRFSGAAIFSETPVTEEVVMAFLHRNAWEVPNPLALPAMETKEPPDADVVPGDHAVCVDCDRVVCICDDEVSDEDEDIE